MEHPLDNRTTFTLVAHWVEEIDRPLPKAENGQFWKNWRLQDDSEASTKPKELLEARIRANLGPALLASVRRYRNIRAHEFGHTSEARFASEAFAFEVVKIKYGSLVVEIAILGLPALLKFLFDNPQVLADFLELCTADALVAAIGEPAVKKTDLDVYTHINDLVVSKVAPPKMSAAMSILHRIQQFWWLLPTVLGMLVMYVAFAGMESERERLRNRDANLAAREAALVAQHQARVIELEKFSLDLVRQLKADAGTCICNCCIPCAQKPPMNTAQKTKPVCIAK